jgi:hypothetical protein
MQGELLPPRQRVSRARPLMMALAKVFHIGPGMTWPYVKLLRRFHPAAYNLSSRPA